MKILHTSDWHLGHALYGYDRCEEQQLMIEQMARIVAEQQPDVMVLSGDVYDTPQPSAAVQKMFSEGMLRIREAWPTMKIIVTAGNHDSGAKHEINQGVWQCLGVEMIGTLRRDEEFWDDYIIEVSDKGYVVAVPYVYERNMPENLFQRLLDRVAERNVNNLPVVMMAHLTVKGSNFSGHEQADERVVGGIESCGLEQMGTGYDYLALGHIHKEQFIKGSNERARYSGTPIAVSFDENYSHSVTMVEIAEHGAQPIVNTIEIENLHPLVTLPSHGYGNWDEVLNELIAYPDEIASYIRLNVEIKDFLPVGAKEMAEDVVKSKECRFCYINPCERKGEQALDGFKEMNVAELQRRTPMEIAELFAKDKGLDFDEEMQHLFSEVLYDIEAESQNN